MTKKEIADLIAQGYEILDIREPNELETLEKLDQATLISDKQIFDKYDQDFEDKDVKLAVVCRAGRRSKIVCDILADKGFKNIKNIDDGMMGIIE
ncbi:rhodanese-like domain-containing protein [Spiroplasma endosymbiont of Panorpa germanica]|uniref:rhodanese-like domain-containing protein n=1 Tax=Spiroplasma endosymbiont of Panorpa germanica TaxID=3066314 RepID=UPI0030D3A0D3